MRTPLVRISVRSVRPISMLLLAGTLAACLGGGGAATTAGGCPSDAPTGTEASAILANARTATLKTSKGTFTMELYGDKAPIATANFVALARCGFYAGITFHRVIAGFVIQAGDPQTKTRRDAFDKLGSGGPGYGFAIEPPADGLNYDRYVVAMANASRPDTNGSQFFVDLADLNDQLPREYTIFGKVVDGTDVVDAIGAVATNGEQGVPIEPVIIESVAIGAG
ncbi:MAG: peptidylprolyl isomerase [Chloroflexota bacterium]|nr:peptidylprolyl isomerase [Chloroflexota bacterium]